eukprot:1148461-Pelagomonas_calceolata.AAC.2
MQSDIRQSITARANTGEHQQLKDEALRGVQALLSGRHTELQLSKLQFDSAYQTKLRLSSTKERTQNAWYLARASGGTVLLMMEVGTWEAVCARTMKGAWNTRRSNEGLLCSDVTPLLGCQRGVSHSKTDTWRWPRSGRHKEAYSTSRRKVAMSESGVRVWGLGFCWRYALWPLHNSSPTNACRYNAQQLVHITLHSAKRAHSRMQCIWGLGISSPGRQGRQQWLSRCSLASNRGSRDGGMRQSVTGAMPPEHGCPGCSYPTRLTQGATIGLDSTEPSARHKLNLHFLRGYKGHRSQVLVAGRI